MGLRRAFAPFLFSRLLIVVILAAGPLVRQIPVSQWQRDDSTVIKLNGSALVDGLRHVALGNDGAWYLGIAKDGYERRPFSATRQANWAFLPLHPLLWRIMATLTGEWFWSGIVLANLLTLAGWSMLWKLVETLTASTEHADDAVLFAAFWPTSYFMTLPQTEPLFFALVVLTLLSACYQRWWLTGLAGMLAGVTRINGAFLLPSAAFQWWQGERKPQDLLKLLPMGVGIAAFMFYLWTITGDPLAFKDIQVAWGRQWALPWQALLDYLHRPARVAVPWNPKLLNFLVTLIGFASVVTCWRRGWRGLAVFTTLTILAPLFTGTLLSMTRFLGVTPGVYLALSVWSGGHKRFGQLCLAFFAVSMTLLCTCLAAGINIGGA
jgi:hypothetical protein